MPKRFVLISLTGTLCGLSCLAQSQPERATAVDTVIDRIIQRENNLFKTLQNYHPLVETYLQNLGPDQEFGAIPKSDRYFLGKLDISKGMNQQSLVPEQRVGRRTLDSFTNFFSIDLLPEGFAQMMLIDGKAFDRRHYEFQYVRREFLGDVRCLVFDVRPMEGAGRGRFLGRIWAEDQDYNIVRFNGTYTLASRMVHYFHFDSWRLQMGPGIWLPAYVYSEESDHRYMLGRRKLQFKAQTRIWAYDLKHAGRQEEFTSVIIDEPQVRDRSEAAENMPAPVQSLREWERQAEENVLDRLERSGLLAPVGEVNKVLETVVSNLEITNNLDIQPPVRCRVLLTAPLESFAVGRTIVLSRGLIDVLPDEASLSMVLAHELGHILLGHDVDTKFAFSDRMLFGDADTLKRLEFRRSEQEEQAADRKGLELLASSPYKDKMANAGLFLRAVEKRAKNLPNLIQPHMGNSVARSGGILRMAELAKSAPELQLKRVDQVAALPLGARLRVDPWSGRIELAKTRPVALLSAREKMAFEVSPIMIHLTRQGGAPNIAAAGSAPGEDNK